MKPQRRKSAEGKPIPAKRVVVIGSYREDLPGLLAFTKSLTGLGLAVLHPPSRARRLGEDDGFVRLNCDRFRDQGRVQRAVFSWIDQADTVILYTPKGRIGVSAAMEIGYSLHACKPILATAPPADATIRALIRYEPTALANFLCAGSSSHGGEHAQSANC